MPRSFCTAVRCFGFLATATFLSAQTAPGPDVLILVDGEKLIGHLKSANGKTVVFKSDIAGAVTVPWAKVQELHSAGKFAAIPKDVIFKKASDADKVPQGTVEVKDQTLEIATAAPAPPTTIPVGNVANVLDEASFQHALHHQGLFEGWNGGATVGLSLTEATTSIINQTAGFNLSRSDPSEGWLDTRNRTTLSFFELYSETRAPFTATSTVSVFQANAVHDMYFSQRVFGFVGATFEHTSPQGLDLLQAYGGGIGFVIVKNDSTSFEARAGIGYMHQAFEDPTLDRNIVGSRFGEDYSKTFKNGITLTEQAGARPAWNYMRAFFAGGNASLTIPIYHRLGLTLGINETFLNDPPPYFKKNNFQVTFGAHYSFQ